ncbi:YhdT family protein [Pontibacillus litoralis]|uniref:Sodium:pantothenate symporter n=1 Tax=Pontibacillus litoralis JSM 072002 TaxID=1385512 RepID=A0A0A5HV55_9BACI|nr:YhdT family protein [Pontibacillus litoralis]KGX87487.1 sodium:pantothenate symporter [Pontibacillus litoralis JSM 072002]
MKQPKDRRFAIANREARIGVVLAIIHFIWWFGFAYGLGGENPGEYTYILGFPAWFFYSCIVGFVIIVLLVVACVKWIFVDVPLDEEGEQR